MADPRLQWRQLNVATPNVSGLLSEMRGGINDAASAAEGILGRYQEGAELKAENELIKRIGGMDQDQLRTAFENGAFSDLNLGKRGLEYLNNAMGARADIRSTNVSSDRTQASIGWGNDANSRANAGEARTAAEYTDGVMRRNWQRENADLFIEGEENAFSRGLAPSSLVRTESGGNFAAQNDAEGAGGTGHFGRVQFGRARFAEAQAAGAVPEGMTIEQFGQNTPEARQAQIRAEEWHFGDIQNQITQRGLDRYIGQTIGGVEITRDGIVAMAHLGGMGGAAQYLESGGRYNPADDNGTSLSDYARTHAGNTTGPSQQGFQPYNIDRGGSEYARAMAASGLFTGQETLGAIDPIRDAATAGQAQIDDQRTTYQNDVLAGITESVVNSPDAISGAEAENLIREMLIETGEFSQAEALAAARRGAEMIGQSEGLSSDLTGGALDAGVAGAIEEAAANTVADATRQFQGQDQYRALNDIGRYAEDPTTNLENDLGIPTDPQTRGDYDSNNLRNYINTMADKYNVEPAVMAVAMRDAFIRDPGDDGAWWEGDFDLTRNTIENRFDPEIIQQTIDQLTPARRREFDRGRSDLKIIESQLEQNAAQQRQVLSRLNKLNENDPNDARTREQLLERLKGLKQAAATLSRQSPTEEDETP